MLQKNIALMKALKQKSQETNRKLSSGEKDSFF
jgi:hypothetical protein